MSCTLILTDHFWRHSILKSLFIKFFSKLALSIAIYFNFRFLKTVFENLLSNLREKVNNVGKLNYFIFLKETNDVCFCALLNKVLEITRLWIVDFYFWLYLPHRV